MGAGQSDAGFAALCEFGGIGGTQPEHYAGDLAVESEQAYIFAAHDSFGFFNVIWAERGGCGCAQPVCERRVVEGCGSAFEYLDDGHAVGGDVVGLGESVGGAADVGEDAVAKRGRVGTERHAELNLIGDDVVFCSAVDKADGENGGLLRIDLAADDGLRDEDKFGSEDDRVLSRFRSGSVPADAADGDTDSGRAGEKRSTFEGDGSGGDVVRVVFGEDEIGTAEALVEVVGEHGAGAVDGFFRGLADEDHGTVPLRFAFGELASGAEEDGHVDVVPAGVHDSDVLALSIGGVNGRGVVEAGLLFDGERVHVAADEKARAGAVLKDGDDAVCLGAIFIFAYMLSHCVAELAEFGGEEGGGLLFVVREFWSAVKVLIGFGEHGELLLDGCREIGWGLGRETTGGRGECGEREETRIHCSGDSGARLRQG